MARFKRGREWCELRILQTEVQRISKKGWFAKKTERFPHDDQASAGATMRRLAAELREGGFECTDLGLEPIEKETRDGLEGDLIRARTSLGGELEAGTAARALDDLYRLRAVRERAERGEFFPSSPLLVDDLDPEPLIDEWIERITEAHGAPGRSLVSEVGANHGIEPIGEVRSGRRRLTFDPEPGPRNEIGFRTSKHRELGELERALVAAPKDREARAVYADRLQELGDPFGEFIALTDADSPEAESLLRANAKAICGGEDVIDYLVLGWNGPFVESVRIDDPATQVPDTAFEALIDSPAGSLLSEIVAGAYHVGDGIFATEREVILERAPLPTIRKLFVADFDHPDDLQISWAELPDLGKLWPALPNLEDVIIQGAEIELGKIDLPRARRFAVRTGGLSTGAFNSIAKAKWPRLEDLEIWFGDSGYGAEVVAPDLEALISNPPPRLTSLGLMNAEFTDEIPSRLIGTELLARLKVLDLSMGTMSDEGAAVILDNIAAFSHLERLNLQDNCIESPADLHRHTFIDAAVQKDHVGEDERFVSVGE